MVAKILAGVVALFAVLFVLFIARLVLLSRDSHSPRERVETPRTLAPCSGRPNCASSQAKEASARVEPFAAGESPAETLARLAEVIADMPGARVVSSDTERGYLHAEFTTRVFRFIDDLELLHDPEAGVFQVRSASRVGYSDLGTNRRRIEELRARFSSAG